MSRHLEKQKRAQANILAFGLKLLLPAHKPRVCHAIASGWPRRPTSPTLYFSCTKPIIKSINNWAFFPVLLNLFLLYISSEMKGRHAGRGGVESARGKRKEWRKKGEMETAQFAVCFHNLKVKWVFNQLTAMSELLSNCSNSSSELLRPGSDPQIYHLHLNTVGKRALLMHMRVRN